MCGNMAFRDGGQMLQMGSVTSLPCSSALDGEGMRDDACPTSSSEETVVLAQGAWAMSLINSHRFTRPSRCKNLTTIDSPAETHDIRLSALRKL